MPDEIDAAAERIEAFNAAALKAALTRPAPVRNDTGECRNCGEQVESDRLAAMPHAHHCAGCAAAIEEDRAREKRRGWR